MEKDNTFETLIGSFISDKVGIDDHFISDKLSQHLQQNILTLIEQKKMISAGTGSQDKLSFDKTVRSDAIYWLDRSHENEYENEFFDQVDDFVKYLNRSCFAGINGYEFHYSLYETGSFYQRHLDQFKNNTSRKYSMISYLNADWKESDGGELVIYQNYNDKKIAPTQGKTVFFKSDELQHEVKLTRQRRMSITGWLKRD
ncbi:MAG: Proline hydroxylase family protein [Bacteroidetes bacterium]|jgi:SM-20-related protein|nr:Proline hydroxylase family protein [Bacteroidota bacterium]MDF2450549.1 Proline hydroxylase family protein [Bacteroidota bacterium]